MKEKSKAHLPFASRLTNQYIHDRSDNIYVFVNEGIAIAHRLRPQENEAGFREFPIYNFSERVLQRIVEGEEDGEEKVDGEEGEEETEMISVENEQRE